MEIYLYYSYLKFRHDRKKPIWIIIKSFPWWIWLALGASAAGVFTFILSFPTARGELWRKLVIIGSLACIKFANIGIERIQIRDSKERMKNFWIYTRNVRKFLSENGVSKKIDIELVKERIDLRVENLQKEQQDLRAGDEKWIQTLAIPTVLAMISPAVSNSGDLIAMISSCATILIIFVLLITVLSSGASIMRSHKNWEITNLRWFAEDLQGVLDLENFNISVNDVEISAK